MHGPGPQVRLARDIVERNAKGAPIHQVPTPLVTAGSRVRSRTEIAAEAKAKAAAASTDAAATNLPAVVPTATPAEESASQGAAAGQPPPITNHQ